MEPFFIYILFGVCAYLLGAIPFGLLVARSRGVDIRKVGSGNIGATNVFRTVGKGWGILAFACDVLKGFIAAAIFPFLARALFGFDSGMGLPLVCGCLAIAGHNWPVYLRFKGGKGVATSVGALIGLAPVAVGIGLLTWAIVFIARRYVSLASIVAAMMTAGAGWFLYARDSILFPIVLTALCVVIIWRHKSNIRRLLNGSENRFEFKKK